MVRRNKSRGRQLGQARDLPEARSRNQPSGPARARPERKWTIAGAGVIVAACLLAYGNSFNGPFIFDDVGSIPDNPHVRTLWPITEAMKAPPQETAAGRPVLSLSLAATYRFCGYDVRGYHAVNLAIHVLAALVLFGIIRRTLHTDRLKDSFAGVAAPVAVICTLLWCLHPLQTQAVTYIIQRAESLMGLFYLLTLYCFLRGATGRAKKAWYAASVVCCALGMGTKEVMVTAPVVVLLFDRTFLAGSFRRALSGRWPAYVGLAATWLILAAIVRTNPRSVSAGFGLSVISSVDYAKTQFQVILHYLRLAVLPLGQSFDYAGWEIPVGLWDLWLPAAVVVCLLTLTAVGLVRRPVPAFLGAWFFLILSPTSSFVPLADVAFEHRMYLPLAAIVSGVVLVGYWLLKNRTERIATEKGRRRIVFAGIALAVAAAAALGVLTFRRNRAYASSLSIWLDTAEKRPDNYRAHNNIGLAYAAEGRLDLAVKHYDMALAARDDDADTYVNRGVAYARSGQVDKALADFNKALKLNLPKLDEYRRTGREIPPNMRKKYSSVYNNRGVIYKNKGLIDLAIQDYNRAIELNPNDASAYCNRAVAYQRKGEHSRSLGDLEKSIAIDPTNAPAYDARGVAYWQMGRFRRAAADFRKAVALDLGEESYRSHLAAALQSIAESEGRSRGAGTLGAPN